MQDIESSVLLRLQISTGRSWNPYREAETTVWQNSESGLAGPVPKPSSVEQANRSSGIPWKVCWTPTPGFDPAGLGCWNLKMLPS